MGYGYNDAMTTQKDTALLPAYLVDGEDHLKREAVLRRLKVRLEKMGDLSFNHDSFEGASAAGEAIVTACMTVPFASEKRLVVVNLAEKLPKKAQSELVGYLKSPSDSTVLVLVTDKLAKNTALYKAVAALGKSAVIDCAPPKKKDLANQVRAMGPTHGLTLTPGAAAALVELVGEDTMRIDAELKKLALMQRASDVVEESHVREAVARVAEPRPWEFVDAFSARSIGECVRMLRLMPSASPYALLRQCVSRIRELMCAQAMLARGGNATASVADALKMPDWKVKRHVQWARSFTPAELRRALETSLETERKMKGGSVPEAAFLDWVVSTLARG